MIFVRKIAAAKWKQTLIKSDDFNADPVTGCLRTSGNTLSLWKINSLSDINEAILALASNFERLDKMDIVTMSEEEIKAANLELENNEGNGKYYDYNHHHFDIVNITYSVLNPVAQLVSLKVLSGDHTRYSSSDLKKILKAGIESKKIKKEDLNSRLQSDLD